MAEEKEQPTEKYLDDFKGDPNQIRKAKSDFITKWGYAFYEALVLRSRKSVQR